MIGHVKRAVGFLADFLGGIEDVSKISAGDLRRFIVVLQQKQMGWPKAEQEGKDKAKLDKYLCQNNKVLLELVRTPRHYQG